MSWGNQSTNEEIDRSVTQTQCKDDAPPSSVHSRKVQFQNQKKLTHLTPITYLMLIII